MDWSIRGWMWYVQGALIRKLGSNRKLFSTFFLLVAFLFILHISIYKSHGDSLMGIRGLGLSLLSREEEEGDGIFREELPEYVGLEETGPPNNTSTSSHVNMRKTNGNHKSKFNKNKNRKKKRPAPKPGSIASRKDKLIFQSTDRKWKVSDGISKNKEQLDKVPSIYRRDIVEDIDWNLEIEQNKRRELRQRQVQVRHECDDDVRSRLKRRIGKVYEHLKWAEDYELIFCPIFKASSTTWLKHLVYLAGEASKSTMSFHRAASNMFNEPGALKKAERLLGESLKFMIVRHPFERLLSAYRDKILLHAPDSDPYRQIQLNILKQYGDVHGVPEASRKKSQHPSFLQFLHKVRDDMKLFWKVSDNSALDPHWTPYWYSCAPCQIRYDVIAKVETLDLDQEFLIRAANLKNVIPNAQMHQSKNDDYADTQEAASYYFEEIPLDLLKELERLYRPDFKLFGYSPNEYYKMAKGMH